MYINHVGYETFIPDWIETCAVDDGVKKYFKDLYARYQADLNMDLSGKAYSYDDLGRLLLDDLKEKELLQSAELIVFPAWSFAWDMKYAVPEFAWKKHYDFQAQMLDVRDCGSLCAFQSMHITLKHYHANTLKNGLCCSIENAWLPIQEKKTVAPEINYWASISHSLYLNAQSQLKILYAEVMPTTNLNFAIHSIFNEYRVNENECAIYANQNHALDYQPTSKNTVFVDHPVSSGFLYAALRLIVKNKNALHTLIIDHDLTLQKTGVLLVKILEDKFYA